MKQYYIFINNVRKGPLTFEELKLEDTTNDTLVWYEGIPEWKKASEIDELKGLFKATPPPINPVSQIPLPPIIKKKSLPEDDSEPSMIFGLNKKLFYVISIIITIGTVGLYNYQASENERIELINSRIDEQEQIETQRRKEAIDKRLFKIRDLLVQNNQALEDSKRHLNDVTGFKLLRTSSERNEQITEAQNNIDYYKEEIKKLETEFEQINPYK